MSRTPVVLRAGQATLTVDADDGARATSWTVDGHELLVGGAGGGWRYGAFVMAPWAGRIRDGEAAWNGAVGHYTRQDDGHALHGLVHSAPWTRIGPSSWSIEVPGPADLPGADGDGRGRLTWLAPLRITQHVELGPDRLRLDLEVEASTPVPATIGWHPWFRRRVAGAAAQIELPARFMYARDADGITTANPVPIPPEPWDDAFGGLEGPVAVVWGDELRLEVEHDGPVTVVFTGEERGVCVEPQTGPPDEVNQRPRVVAPGTPLRLASTWRWSTGRPRD